MRVLQSEESDVWVTPPGLRKKIERRWNLDYDPCPVQPKQDGLSVRWGERCFVNPPYSDAETWLEKAHREILDHETDIAVFLLFANTDTAWFHDLILGKSRIYFIQGRVKFCKPSGEQRDGAMRPSMLCVFSEETIRDGVDEQDLRRFGSGGGDE